MTVVYALEREWVLLGFLEISFEDVIGILLARGKTMDRGNISPQGLSRAQREKATLDLYRKPVPIENTNLEEID